jgi:hypothetical protein
MVSMLASSAVYRGFKPLLGQTKDYKIGISCFSTKNTALWRKSKDWLIRNQDNVSEWGDMSIADCCFSDIPVNPPPFRRSLPRKSLISRMGISFKHLYHSYLSAFFISAGDPNGEFPEILIAKCRSRFYCT